MRLLDETRSTPRSPPRWTRSTPTLAGEPVDPRYAELAELALLLAAERPEIDTAFAPCSTSGVAAAVRAARRAEGAAAALASGWLWAAGAPGLHVARSWRSRWCSRRWLGAVRQRRESALWPASSSSASGTPAAKAPGAPAQTATASESARHRGHSASTHAGAALSPVTTTPIYSAPAPTSRRSSSSRTTAARSSRARSWPSRPPRATSMRSRRRCSTSSARRTASSIARP